jgi:hypothetical protein
VNVWEDYPIHGTAKAIEGSTVCHTGRVTGGSCGNVISTFTTAL